MHLKYGKTVGWPVLGPVSAGRAYSAPQTSSWSGGGWLPSSQKLHPAFGHLVLTVRSFRPF